MTKSKDEINIEYKDIKDLSNYDPNQEYIELYNKADFVDNVLVFTDRKNDDREYIIINNEVVYLDNIECLND